ncbi:membrane-associated Zn-dependent protease [Methanobrevibacter sp. YE315]|uniref:site-2 protease family protein n=1 Tax=Methanobrevibacter sp. YE315 TaxID=1609968 RepID=UPI000764D08D|nr:site-2 protease family protein [Methanobrevibacter sp. YE315]AMD16635.1 membrane-associated Zn-dependent protease [Methanobrevibacter sp. YE315]
MNGIYYYLIAFAVIWILVGIFHEKLSNHGVELNFPVIMWKTTKLRGLISRINNISPKFWKWYMNVGIVISFAAMIFISWTLISSLQTALEAPSVSIVIPGVEIPGSPIFVPFLSGFIALATVLVVHEFSHGVQCVGEKVPIKSIGLLLFAILPGAFVEPDEDELKKASKISRLRVYGAGSMANMTLALIAILIVMGAAYGIPHFFAEDGIEISHIVGDSPSDGVLKEGMVVESIDGHVINDSQTYLNFVGSFKPGDNITVGTDQGDYSVVLGKNPNNESIGFFGIQAGKHFKLADNSLGPLPWALFTIIDIFQWIFTLNLGIGLFNLLPIKPLDGGHMLEILLTYKLTEAQAKPIVNAISAVFAMIVIFSVLAGFLG